MDNIYTFSLYDHSWNRNKTVEYFTVKIQEEDSEEIKFINFEINHVSHQTRADWIILSEDEPNGQMHIRTWYAEEWTSDDCIDFCRENYGGKTPFAVKSLREWQKDDNPAGKSYPAILTRMNKEDFYEQPMFGVYEGDFHIDIPDFGLSVQRYSLSEALKDARHGLGHVIKEMISNKEELPEPCSRFFDVEEKDIILFIDPDI